MLLSQLFLFSWYTKIAKGRTQRYLTSHYVTITNHTALFKAVNHSTYFTACECSSWI